MLKTFFTRRWILATLLVIAAVGVMVRLGIWQLERLAERKAFNARVTAQIEQPPLELTGDALNLDLVSMEYRSVVVTGVYDHAQEIALRNRAYENHRGVDLLTPLVIAGTNRAVLVNRGWIPIEEASPDNWKKFAEPGTITVRGVIRRSQSKADFGAINDPPGKLQLWNLVNIPRIQEQISYTLLPVYLQQSMDQPIAASNATVRPPFPIRSQVEVEISEGSHLGYALQWFTFATILVLGYPAFVHARMQAKQK